MVNPAFFFVHGAWFSSTVFSSVVTDLWSKGYPSWTGDLPTASGDPSKTAQDDIDFLALALEQLSDKGFDITPVIWSYGAWVGGAAIQNVTKDARAQAGKQGGVIGLVYAAAVIPQVGETAGEIMAAWGGANNSWYDPQQLQQSNITNGPLIELGNPQPIFYNDCPYPDPSIFNTVLRPWAAGAFTTPIPFVPITPDGRPVVPTAYIHSLHDLSVPTKVQDQVLEKYNASFSEVIKVNSGHLWMIDQPKKSAEGLVKFVSLLSQ